MIYFWQHTGVAVIKNRMQRTAFGPRRKDGTGGSRKVYEKFDKVYTIPSIYAIIKPRMR
jgi:hypothetical protein